MQPQAPNSQTPVPSASTPPALPDVPAPAATGQPSAPVPTAASAPVPAPAVAAKRGEVASPAIADDGDLIEKDWVEKTEHIITSMQNDPAAESAAFSKLKADYMQKRYGKSLKSDS